MHYVYIVQCADGTLYTGYAIDLDKRIDAHNAGRGAKYTAGRRPVSVVYSESFALKSDALKREHELKRRTRRDKEALIAQGDRHGKPPDVSRVPRRTAPRGSLRANTRRAGAAS